MPGTYFARRDLVCSLPEPGWNYGHERSPFYRYSLEQGATYCIYNRRMMPVSLTTSDRDQAYWALRRGVTRLDTGELVTEIVGPDAVRLLNLIFSRDVSRLRPGRSMYAIACWPDGGVLVDGILIGLEENRFWYCQADGDLVGWMKAHAVGLDCEVFDPQSWVQQIQGPKSLDVLAEACDDGLPDPFKFFDAREVTMGGQEVLVTRTGWTGEIGFEIYTRPELDFDALWDHVTQAGAKHSMLDIGLDGMDIRRIEAEILNNGSDMDSSMTPFEAGLGDFIDLNKPDFFGKEALTTADQRRRIYGLACKTAEPLIRGPVMRGDEQIGHTTTAGWSPFLEQGIGYVRLNSADLLEPRQVEVMGFDLEMHHCEIVDLPFYDEAKNIPRGLEVAQV